MMERLRVRHQVVDMGRCEIVVRDGKGAKDRVNMMPASLRTSLVAHVDEVERVHRAAVVAAGWAKRATCHSLRHSSATNQSPEDGYDIRTVQEVLGHSDVNASRCLCRTLA